ncbi:hypothetical protein ABZT03_33945 [Streptomyces sp. NPDC005574]
MASMEQIVTAVGRAPDFVPMWVQVLIFAVPMGIVAVVMQQRNKS